MPRSSLSTHHSWRSRRLRFASPGRSEPQRPWNRPCRIWSSAGCWASSASRPGTWAAGPSCSGCDGGWSGRSRSRSTRSWPNWPANSASPAWRRPASIGPGRGANGGRMDQARDPPAGQCPLGLEQRSTRSDPGPRTGPHPPARLPRQHPPDRGRDPGVLPPRALVDLAEDPRRAGELLR